MECEAIEPGLKNWEGSPARATADFFGYGRAYKPPNLRDVLYTVSVVVRIEMDQRADSEKRKKNKGERE